MKFNYILLLTIFLILSLLQSNAQSHTFPTFDPGTLTSGTTGISTTLNTAGLTKDYMVFIITADFVGTGNVAWSSTIHAELNNGASTIYKEIGKSTSGSADDANATTLVWTGIMKTEYAGGGTLNIRFFDDYHDASGPYTSSITNVKLAIYEVSNSHQFATYSPGTLTSGTSGLSAAMNVAGVSSGGYLLYKIEADFVGTGNVAWSSTIHSEISNGGALIHKTIGKSTSGSADDANATTLIWTGIMNAEYAGGGNLSLRFFDDYHDASGPYTSDITNVKFTIYPVSTPHEFAIYSPGTLTSGTSGLSAAMNVAGMPSGNHLLYKIEADFVGTGNVAWSSTIHTEVSNGAALIYKNLDEATSGSADNANATTLVWTGFFNAEYQSGDPITLRFFDDFHDASGPYTSNITNVRFTLFNGAGVLVPVELTSFSGKNEEEINYLNWLTASEKNNKGFEIERSLNGRDFENIGFVEGNGNAANINQYDFTDENVEKGIHYYRLKQIDFDGAYEYSKIVQLTVAEEGFQLGRIYPNPSKNEIVKMDYFSEESSEIRINILDVTGKLIFENEATLEEGNHSLELDFSHLGKGVYFVQFHYLGKSVNRKIVVQ